MRRPRAIKVAAAVAVVGALAGGGVALSRSSVFGISSIEVVGERALSETEVLRASGLRLGLNVVGLDFRAVEQRVAALPLVREVTVERAGALGVVIRIFERAPAVEVHGKAARWYVDERGRPITPRVRPGLLPVLRLKAGQALVEPAASRAVETILRLWDALPPRLRARVVAFDLPAGRSLTFRLDATTVIFGRPDRIRDKLRAVEMVLRDASAEGTTVRRLDVRAPRRPAAVVR